MSYCCSIWGCCSESKFEILLKIQNRVARIITGSSYDVSAAPNIQNLSWKLISNLARKETVTLTYKSLNVLAPDYLTKLFTKCLDDRERFLRSSQTDLKMPLLKTISGQKAFSHGGKNHVHLMHLVAGCLRLYLYFLFVFSIPFLCNSYV